MLQLGNCNYVIMPPSGQYVRISNMVSLEMRCILPFVCNLVERLVLCFYVL